MTVMFARWPALARWAAIALCAWLAAGTVAAQHAERSEDAIARGAYLVNLLGCGRCHTEGLLTGDAATGPHLAGSKIGIAYTAYNEQLDEPGVVFPSNLTPDPETGLGTWTKQDIVAAMTRGIAKSGHERLTVMPWINYGAVNEEDMSAIVDYLMSLPPIRYEVPAAVPQGERSTAEYVRFGTYRFTPHWHLGTDSVAEPANEDDADR